VGESIDKTGSLDVTRVESAAEPAHAPEHAPVDVFALPSREPLLGRYTLLRKLGEGGMGVVYAAYDQELDRRVALKLLRARDRGERAASRMQREAQAMARLSHPNVVQVYDVGLVGGRLFVAMEHVSGQSLREWARVGVPGEKDRSERTWREVVAMYVQAGEGLAAAHAAGLVHRDFKPDNVLVGDDGRPRVLDFGLAARNEPADESRTSGSVPPLHDTSRSESGAKLRSTDLQLTAEGTLIGTPAYMSPEQHLRNPADHRSDQFSFCVALYEALYGERPFIGATLVELRAAVFSGHVREPPAGRKLPGWLRRVVLRGLSIAAEDRYPDMPALLVALRTDPGRARRRWLLALGVAALVGVAVAAVMQQRAASAQMCRGADDRISSAWNPDRALAVERALRGTGQAYASGTWRRVQGQFDMYAEAWRAAYVDTCEATWVRGEQSAELLDLRMACLGNGLEELRALVDVLAEADAKVAERAVQAVAELRPLRRCADITALRAPAAAPTAVVPAVQEVRSKLALMRAEDAAGRYIRGLELANEAVAAAEATAYPPIRVDALLARGRVQEHLGEYDAAEKALVDAYARAEAIGHEEAKAEAAILLVRITGDRQSDKKMAAVWARLGDAALERLGRPREPQIEYLAAVGSMQTRFGRLDEALATLDEALALDAELPGVHPRRALFHRYRGNALYRQGKYPAAQAEYARSVELAEASLGAEHPEVANSISNLGEAQRIQGHLDLAEQNFARALTVWEQSLGPDSPKLAVGFNGLASIAYERGDLEAAAREYRRIVGLYERTLGPEHADVGIILGNLGEVELRQGKFAEARATLERAIALIEGGLGADHALVADARSNLGEVLLALGEPEAAAAEYDAAIAVHERAGNLDHPELAKPLAGRGRLALSLRKPAEAAPLFERALALRTAGGGEAVDLAELRLGLAEALWDGQLDRARARELVEESRAALASAAASAKRTAALAAAEAWLAGHPSH
jgi:tetratricopeptide (TPR) repeat protein